MFIKTISIENFKCFGSNRTEIHFNQPDGINSGSGLNILVGENNSGKSTVFEAFAFLRDGLGRSKTIDTVRNKRCPANEFVAVEMTFSGEVDLIVNAFGQKNKIEAIKKYIYKDTERQHLRMARSSRDEKEDDLLLWDPLANELKNEAGIAAPLQKLFEIDYVWSDTNPNDVVKFGATTVCGKLLKEITRAFSTTQEYRDFQSSFEKTFNSVGSPLRSQLKGIERKTQDIFETQFGQAKITFDFAELESDSFFKNTRIMIDDGLETDLEDKGSGMQRSLALALLQVYAETLKKHPQEKATKPFFLVIDEPEVCLHPQAQKKLLLALMEIAKSDQVFLATHSPYFIEPSLVHCIQRLRVGVDQSITVLHSEGTSLREELRKKENRKFFFHHRDLFFTNRVIFLEGATDRERYELFCEKSGFVDLPKLFMTMNGCNNVFFFEELCITFGVQFFAIVDRDFSFERPYWVNKDRKEFIQRFFTFCEANTITLDTAKIEKVLENQTKEVARGGKCATQEAIIGDMKIHRIKDRNIYVLQKGEVTDYLNGEGDVVNEEQEIKKKELIAIFSAIRKEMSAP